MSPYAFPLETGDDGLTQSDQTNRCMLHPIPKTHGTRPTINQHLTQSACSPLAARTLCIRLSGNRLRAIAKQGLELFKGYFYRTGKCPFIGCIYHHSECHLRIGLLRKFCIMSPETIEHSSHLSPIGNCHGLKLLIFIGICPIFAMQDLGKPSP